MEGLDPKHILAETAWLRTNRHERVRELLLKMMVLIECYNIYSVLFVRILRAIKTSLRFGMYDFKTSQKRMILLCGSSFCMSVERRGLWYKMLESHCIATISSQSPKKFLSQKRWPSNQTWLYSITVLSFFL